MQLGSGAPEQVSRRKIVRREVDHVGAFLNPVVNERDALRRKGIAPKNHAADNLARIRDLENQAKQRTAEEEARAREGEWKMPEFRDVAPKVVPGEIPPTTPTHTEFLRSRGGMTSIAATAMQNAVEPGTRAPRQLSKPPVPRQAEEEGTIERRSAPNFLQENKIVAMAAPQRAPAREAPKETAKEINPEYGRVPQYLVERRREQEQANEEARRREEEAAPPGLVMLPEDERQATLTSLAQQKEETLSALHRMPIAIRTPTSERKRAELEQQLHEIEASIRLFSAPKVAHCSEARRQSKTTSLCHSDMILLRPRAALSLSLFMSHHEGFPDTRFVHPESLFPEFNCSSCGCVMRRPVSVGCPTNHKMCQACCEEWFKQKRECPECRSPVPANAPTLDISLHAMIGRQIVFCTNKENGCDWQGKLEDAEEHEARGCLCRSANCTHPGCNFRCVARDLPAHMDTCPHKLTHCQHCQQELPQGFLEAHFETCPRIPVSCPDGCGVSIPRSEMPQHQSTCPNGRVDCPVPNCPQHQILRRALEQHLVDPFPVHTRALIDGLLELQQTKADLAATRATLADTQATLAATQATLAATQSELRNHIEATQRALAALTAGRVPSPSLVARGPPPPAVAAAPPPPSRGFGVPPPPSRGPAAPLARSNIIAPPAQRGAAPAPYPPPGMAATGPAVFAPPPGVLPLTLSVHLGMVEPPYVQLLNTAPCPIRDEMGYVHKSLDHYYFAQMAADDPSRLMAVRMASSSSAAREATRGAVAAKFNRQRAMRQGLLLKFGQHPELRNLLVSTHPRPVCSMFPPWIIY
ncbi:putative TNF receptor-associated factor 3 [Paratrimastix pyriformis]|uniref:TNF receptor-associated factor 3 n=1 Tax=Paratrimastix pyriformis TaxID=342808 RepID=A0ABQ8U9M6_9EUKA|nr:putative TNF receptor-associated factor 3 [Paratrimastix pyriformis]